MGEDATRTDGAQTVIAGEPGLSARVIEEQFGEVFADFEAALRDDVAAHRLQSFDFTAVIRVKELDHLEAWLLFHGNPEVRDSGAGADIDIEVVVPAALLENFWSRHLALEILEGRATYTGQVRRLLSMMPVIRAAVERSRAEEPIA